MNLFKKLFLTLLVTFSSTNLLAYSYAAAGKEKTIDAREAILKHVNNNNFDGAQQEFNKVKENYIYLSTIHDKKLSTSLEMAIKDKKPQEINRWLNISLAAEINRRLDGGSTNIKTYNVAKVMLAKANKFYKLLESSLTKEQKQNLSIAINNCIQAIGNPGLFGVGAKPANETLFKQNQQNAVEILKSL